jgi:hypothetical protein
VESLSQFHSKSSVKWDFFNVTFEAIANNLEHGIKF